MKPAAAGVAMLVLLAPDARGDVLDVGSGQTYATIADAVQQAAAGDVIRVHAGTYTENLALASSGASGMPVRIEPVDGPVVLQGNIDLDGSYWEIVGIEIVAPAGTDAIRIAGDYNRILEIDLHGGDRDGIDGAGTGNEVRDSSIHDFDAGTSDAHCIVLNPGATDWVITDNELFDCSGDSIQLYSSGFERSIVNVRIEHNHMYWSGAIGRMENGLDVKNADGLEVIGNAMHGFADNKTIVFQKGPANIVLECNVLHDGLTGVEFRAEDGGTVENVRFVRNLMHSFADYALKFDGTVGAEVLHNTFVDAANDGLRIEGLGLDGGTVRNNLWVRTGAIEPGTFTADHNGFFDTGNIGIASADDVNADPLLDADHVLGAESPMIDAGLDVSLPFMGRAPDIGWSEVDLDACGRLPGEGGAGGSSGSGAGGSGGASGPNGAGGSAGAAASPQDDSSCSCRTAGGSDARWLWWSLLGIVAVRAGRRR